MRLFYAGAEQAGWRTKLSEFGVENVSLSWIGLRRRGQKQLNTPLAELFPGDQKIYLDSGAYTLNKADSEVTDEEAVELAWQYYAYVRANIDRIEFASEFDALILGKDQIRLLRENTGLPVEKIMPIWHADYGVQQLRAMATLYPRLGVLQDDTAGDLTQTLRNVARETKLHGVAMTKMDAMKAVPWDSVGSTSWLSPTQYGDTFVWTGHELKRYPKRMKEQARKRHRTWLAGQGFDMEKIEADDNDELLRLSVWSWQNYSESLRTGRPVTNVDIMHPFGNAESAEEVVDTPAPEMRNAELVPRAEKKLLPVLGFSFQEQTDADGEKTQIPVMETPSTGLLQCDTCYMSAKCPAMEPGSECKYEIPVKIRTAAQVAALQDSLIEMQTQRVLLMRMIEQAEGGYVDANLSSEIDRLNKLIKTKQDAGKEGFSINIANVQAPQGPGIIRDLMGTDVADRMSALPQGETDSETWVAEIVEEGGK